MKIIMMILAIGLILIAGLVIFEVSICKRHPRKKYILPLMCLFLAVLSVFGGTFFAVVAYVKSKYFSTFFGNLFPALFGSQKPALS